MWKYEQLQWMAVRQWFAIGLTKSRRKSLSHHQQALPRTLRLKSHFDIECILKILRRTTYGALRVSFVISFSVSFGIGSLWIISSHGHAAKNEETPQFHRYSRPVIHHSLRNREMTFKKGYSKNPHFLCLLPSHH